MNSLNRKRALVLSGGGSKGAHTVGVVKALLEDGRQYDVISGVSVGALIGAHLAMYPPEQQLETYHKLEKIWLDIKGNKSIYKNWAPGFLTYVWSLWKGGIYNMKPLRNILEKEMDLQALRTSGVEFMAGCVSLTSGKYSGVNVTSNAENNAMAVDWVWASTIFPVLFAPVKINGEQWLDGGVRNVIPLKDVLQYNVTDIDVVITTPMDKVTSSAPIRKSVIHHGIRSVQLSNDEVYINDFTEACKQQTNRNIQIFEPEKKITVDSFDFNPKTIRENIQSGYTTTKKKLVNL